MTVGERIKQIRQEKGLTQKELGKKCGLADSAIRRYELGGANPKLETQKRIAKALGVPVSLLNNELYVTEDMDSAESSELLAYALIDGVYNLRKQDLVNAFDSLNSSGQIEAVKQVEMLTKIPEYQIKSALDIKAKSIKNGHITIGKKDAVHDLTSQPLIDEDRRNIEGHTED